MSKAKLYVIGTPLGNRDDITLRALTMLRSLTCFFVEDTREFYKLLQICEISPEGKEANSYSSHNLKEATERAVEKLLAGVSVGLCTDRGMPGISDPGFLLVSAAREKGILIVPVPGPSSVTTALSVSGLDTDRFIFLGFLSQKAGERREVLEKAATLQFPICFFESPNRVLGTIDELKTFFPHGLIFIAREMTKSYESFYSGSLAQFSSAEIPEKGEFVVVVEPGPPPESGDAWEKELEMRLSTDKVWSKWVGEKYDLKSSDVYNALQRAKKKEE